MMLGAWMLAFVLQSIPTAAVADPLVCWGTPKTCVRQSVLDETFRAADDAPAPILALRSALVSTQSQLAEQIKAFRDLLARYGQLELAQQQQALKAEQSAVDALLVARAPEGFVWDSTQQKYRKKDHE